MADNTWFNCSTTTSSNYESDPFYPAYDLGIVERVVLVPTVRRNEGLEHLHRLVLGNALFLSHVDDIHELRHVPSNPLATKNDVSNKHRQL